MKKKVILIVIALLALISFLLIYVNYKGKAFGVSIAIKNNTSVDQDTPLRLSLWKDSSSDREELISLTALEKDSNVKKEVTVSTPTGEGDYGLVLNINDSDQSLYFMSGTRISYVNYDLRMEEDFNGDIILHGEVKIKRLFSTAEIQEIEPMIVKESNKNNP